MVTAEMPEDPEEPSHRTMLSLEPHLAAICTGHRSAEGHGEAVWKPRWSLSLESK